MDQIKSVNIVPIGVYCFLLGLFFLVAGINTLVSNKAPSSGIDFNVWLPVIACVIFAVSFVIVGIGILKEDYMSWRVLFFCLATCVSSIASGILACLFFLVLDTGFVNTIMQTNHITSVEIFSFLAFFLSEIIVLYYLTRNDIVSRFGGMDELVSPF